MARQPKQTSPVEKKPELNETAHQDLAASAQLVIAQDAYSDERDLLNQLIGQAQMAEAFSKFSVTVTTSKLAFVKENKLYRSLAGKKTGDVTSSGTWDEFCSLLGRSREQVDEDIRNLKVLGEDALDSMGRMGIGYRDLRQYRRLPSDQRTELIEAAKSGDKDTFLELAEDLIAKHAKEKESLTKRAEDAEGDLESSRQRVAVKEKEAEKLTGEVLKLKRRVETETPDEAAAAIRKEAAQLSFNAEHAINKNLREGLQKLVEHAATNGGNHAEFMLGLITQVEHATNMLRADFGLLKAKPDGEITPDWMRDDVQEQLKADAEKLKPDWMKDLEAKNA